MTNLRVILYPSRSHNILHCRIQVDRDTRRHNILYYRIQVDRDTRRHNIFYYRIQLVIRYLNQMIFSKYIEKVLF